jgi:hypothetical protein
MKVRKGTCQEVINRSAHVPEKQMIFRFLCAISVFCIGRKLVLGTESSFLASGAAGGVIAAGILKYAAGSDDVVDVVNQSDE